MSIPSISSKSPLNNKSVCQLYSEALTAGISEDKIVEHVVNGNQGLLELIKLTDAIKLVV